MYGAKTWRGFYSRKRVVTALSENVARKAFGEVTAAFDLP